MIRQVTYTVAGGQLNGSDVIIGRADVGDYELVATGAGVSCVDSITRLLKSYATLANITALAYNSVTGDLWLATAAAGAYKIALATLSGGNGDVTPVGWAATLTAATPVAIYSNACTGIAINDAGTRLAVACGRVTLVVLAAGVPSASYDSSEYAPCNGAIAADGNRLAWVRNGDVGMIHVLEDMTTPAADGWNAPVYGHISDSFDTAGSGVPDAARWALSSSGSPGSTTWTETAGAVTMTMVHRNSAGTDQQYLTANYLLGVDNYSVSFAFGAYSTSALGAADGRRQIAVVDWYDANGNWLDQAVAWCKKSATTEWLDLDISTAGTTTITPLNWSGGITVRCERSGTTINWYYNTGGGEVLGKTAAAAGYGTHVAIKLSCVNYNTDQTAAYNSTTSVVVTGITVNAPASYDALPTALINALAIKSGADTTRLLLGTADGAALIDTDESAAPGSLPNFTVETYGASGADHNILESNAVRAVALNDDGDAALVGTDAGLDVVDLTDDTRSDHLDTATTPALLSDNVTGVWYGSMIYGSDAGLGILDEAGSAALLMMMSMRP